MFSLKRIVTDVLKRHPYGSLLGVTILDRFDALLPHDPSYFGFARFAQAYDFVPKVILDIGANRGHSARGFLKILPGWQVISFEANGIHEARLAAIQARHQGRFTYHIAAVTDASRGHVEFYTPTYRGTPLSSAGALSHAHASAGAEIPFPRLRGKFGIVQTSTPTLSLDELGLEACFVKMDIQGGELDALKGMRSLLERCKPVLLIEMDFEASEVADHLAALEYQPWAFDAADGTFAPGWASVSKRGEVNQFFVHLSLAAKIPQRARHVATDEELLAGEPHATSVEVGR
jgi:FkbM family methyltransferase